MNGAHDLGGKHGFGPIDRSQQENFKYEWEEKVFALTLACGMLGKWNLDQSRYSRERADPVDYLAGSYYEHWLHGLELMLVEHGLLSEEEVASGCVADDRPPVGTAVSSERVDSILSTGGPTLMEATAPPRFSMGECVVVKAGNPSQHTRCPGYIKGKAGVVVSHHGAHVYADHHADTGNKLPAHLYSVKFESVALWGESASDRCPVYVDCFEPYLLSMEQHLSVLESMVGGAMESGNG